MLNIKLQSITLSVLGGFLLLILPTGAQATSSALPNTGDPQSMVCVALANIMPCGTSTPVAKKLTTTTQPTSTASILGSIFGFGSGSGSTVDNRSFTSNISQGFLGKTQKNEAVILVKAPDHSEIYRIIGGKRFLIPNDTVFDSYGYLVSDIHTMSWAKVMAYPRVKLIKDGNPDVYYLTEGGMTRDIPTQAIFDSYADSNEDVVIINKTEFSLYPQNRYIFNESTYTTGRRPNVYLISGSTKKLVFPDQLARDSVTNSMIAPVNQTEFDYYTVFLAITTKQRTWFNWF